MDLLVTVVIGLGIGVMVELLLPGHTPSELVLAMILGITGALLARYLGAFTGWYSPGEPESFLASLLAAVAVLLLYGALFRRNKRPRP